MPCVTRSPIDLSGLKPAPEQLLQPGPALIGEHVLQLGDIAGDGGDEGIELVAQDRDDQQDQADQDEHDQRR